MSPIQVASFSYIQHTYLTTLPHLLELVPTAYIPLFIFFARILDVSIGTLRIMFVSKGLRGRATIYGFIEVLIWIVVVAQIFQNLDNAFYYVAYAGGFACGTFAGMYIEEKMKMGVQIFRFIVTNESSLLQEKLIEARFKVTTLDGEGKYGPVQVLLTIVKRKRWQELTDLVGKYAPNAFYSVEDVKHVSLLDEDITSGHSAFTRMLKLKKGL